ncbi:hypothetical protein WH47_05352 [Habropoda laboriosa]|uniref:Uncharacterized protein n=1 Tax=Habropoda laboriosa TaxID=597456 RepID=A0A0L7QTZ1_9HYME|nr:hypothetical protein WH47_05352 [Habropoda laboriosa]
MELMVSWGDSQSWKTSVVAMTTARDFPCFHNSNFTEIDAPEEKKNRNPFTDSRYALERSCSLNDNLSTADSLTGIDSVIEEHFYYEH